MKFLLSTTFFTTTVVAALFSPSFAVDSTEEVNPAMEIVGRDAPNSELLWKPSQEEELGSFTVDEDGPNMMTGRRLSCVRDQAMIRNWFYCLFNTCGPTTCSADHNSNVPCCGQPSNEHEYTDNVQSCPEDFPKCTNYEAGIAYGSCKRPCSADHNSNVPCCGQPSNEHEYTDNVKSCPEDFPKCTNYEAGVVYGSCEHCP